MVITGSDTPVVPQSICFHNADKEVGKFTFDGDELKFEGNADESAKIFVDYVIEQFNIKVKGEN